MNGNRKMVESEVKKPCHRLHYCPYGPMVEDFPLAKSNQDRNCKVFGHVCPIYFCRENIQEPWDYRLNISLN